MKDTLILKDEHIAQFVALTNDLVECQKWLKRRGTTTALKERNIVLNELLSIIKEYKEVPAFLGPLDDGNDEVKWVARTLMPMAFTAESGRLHVAKEILKKARELYLAC